MFTGRSSVLVQIHNTNNVCFVLFVLFSYYSHQSISDYSWEVYIVHSGVFAG